MSLASGARRRAALSWLTPMVVGAGLLAGCQSTGQAPPPEVLAERWRVVERVGEARYLAPGAGSWAAALPATLLPDGSRVATGAGGRLILARARERLSAGPGSEFSLPERSAGAPLAQTAGRLRYRLTGPEALTVTTPALALQVADSAFAVMVDADGTEVAVERGRVRVATPDDRREIELEAGQSARAGGQAALAYRRAGGRPLERVEPVVLPALRPEPALLAGAPPGPSLTMIHAAAEHASNSAAAGVESAVPIATAGPVAAALAPSAAVNEAPLPAPPPAAPLPPAAPPAAVNQAPRAMPPTAAGEPPLAAPPLAAPVPPAALPAAVNQAPRATPPTAAGEPPPAAPSPAANGAPRATLLAAASEPPAMPLAAVNEAPLVASPPLSVAPRGAPPAAASEPPPATAGDALPVEMDGGAPGRVALEPVSPPPPGAEPTAATGPASAPVPNADPGVGTDGDDQQSPYERLTRGMVDGLPARPAPHEPRLRAPSL
jgi:hypothetical protein